jgi:hypothetical protein
MPESITSLIHYMDKLEPQQNYFKRQQDSRGECSKTRGKLRKFARAKPNHYAVAHWVKSKKWQPPNQETLDHMITLIKTMIK